MRIQIFARMHPNDIKTIVDYHLPTDQLNLDFKLYDPPQLVQGTTKDSKASERAKRQRNLHIDDNGYY